MDIAKTTLYVVSDDGHTPMSLEGVVSMINGGGKAKDVSIFTNQTEAQSEYSRRCAVNEVITIVRKFDIEVVKVIDRAVRILEARNWPNPEHARLAQTLIDLLNAAEVPDYRRAARNGD